MRFYEINPEVIRLAEEHFTFLKDCQGKIEMVLGDARLSLEQEPPQRFDLLVLDAFSGDAVPSHLLTKEAFEIYLRHLVHDGTIAVHITNTYLDLAPVVRALAEEYGFQRARIETPYDEARQLYRADWMLLTRNKDLIAAVEPACLPGEWQETKTLLWTDDHSNLYEILK
jgi:spermidine synthase